MTTSLQTRTPAGFVEKTPLERYAAPDKPSLIGLSRAELAEALGTVGVRRSAAPHAGASRSGTGSTCAAPPASRR